MPWGMMTLEVHGYDQKSSTPENNKNEPEFFGILCLHHHMFNILNGWNATIMMEMGV